MCRPSPSPTSESSGERFDHLAVASSPSESGSGEPGSVAAAGCPEPNTGTVLIAIGKRCLLLKAVMKRGCAHTVITTPGADVPTASTVHGVTPGVIAEHARSLASATETYLAHRTTSTVLRTHRLYPVGCIRAGVRYFISCAVTRSTSGASHHSANTSGSLTYASVACESSIAGPISKAGSAQGTSSGGGCAPVVTTGDYESGH